MNPILSYRRLFLFSVPVILATVSEPIAGVIDTALLGNLSTDWLAILGIAVTILSSFAWIFNFLINVSTTKISSYVSHEKWDEARRLIAFSLILSLILGILASLVVYLISPLIFKFMNVSDNLIEDLKKYLNIRLFGFFLIVTIQPLLGFLRGAKFVRLSLYFILAGVVTNISLTYLCLYIFDLGIDSAAWASNLGHLMTNFLALLKVREYFKITFSHFYIKNIKIKEVFYFGKDSINVFLRTSSLTIMFFLASTVATRIGNITIAAHQVALQIWLFSSFISDGFAATAQILGAEYYATSKYEDLKLLIRRVLLIGVSFSFVTMILYGVFYVEIISLFTNDPLVVALVETLWLVFTLSIALNYTAYIFDGVMYGLGQFGFMRNLLLSGLMVLVLPGLYISYDLKSFSSIWYTIILLNIYRVAFCFIKIYNMKKSWNIR